ncbi:TlpA family protein disulfide reductase [candidate division FCPU426 bacterium]|nr:TlpA family protein disulfide reductase [candidate division FCPU426 bacterium]
MRRLFSLSVIILAGVLLGCQGTASNAKTGGQASQAETAALAADVFPDFTVKTLDGEEKNLKDYRGKILILDLFATWCPPCRMEIPHFVELQKEHADTVAVVGLSYDQTSADKVKAFAKEMKINYDVFWGSEQIANHVGLRGIPHTLVIDQQGRVARSYVGYRAKNIFENDIQALQKSGSAAPVEAAE